MDNRVIHVGARFRLSAYDGANPPFINLRVGTWSTDAEIQIGMDPQEARELAAALLEAADFAAEDTLANPSES